MPYRSATSSAVRCRGSANATSSHSVAEQGVAPDVSKLPHEPGADETDPYLRGHALPVGDRAARVLEDLQLRRLIGVSAAELDVELDAPAGLVRELEVTVRKHERLS